MTNRNRAGAAALAAVAATALGAPAGLASGAIPTGHYKCYEQDSYENHAFAADLTLKKKGKYDSVDATGNPGNGKYRTKKAKINFKTGPYDVFAGKWTTKKSKTTIKLTMKSNPNRKQVCTRKK